MFGNAYQNGPTLEIWDARVNLDKNPFYQQLFAVHPATNKKYFDKDSKSYLLALQGNNCKITLPARDDHLNTPKTLAVNQRYLVVQAHIPLGYPWSLELGLSDLNGTKHRVLITTAQGRQEIKYFSLRYPIDNLSKGVWLFLGVDLYSFMGAFKEQVFRCLDQITISGNCRLRRIFSMKEWAEYNIPKAYWFGNEIAEEFQLIEYSGNQAEGGIGESQVSQKLQSKRLPSMEKQSMSPQKAGTYSISQSSQSNGNGNGKHLGQSYLPPIRQESEGGKLEVSPVLSSKVKSKLMKSNKSMANKSELSIIEQAKMRLNSLQKQEEEIITQSKHLDQYLSQSIGVSGLNLSKINEKQRQRSDKMKEKMPFSIHPKNSISPQASNKSKLTQKAPHIEKSFEEDEALPQIEQSSRQEGESSQERTPLPRSGKFDEAHPGRKQPQKRQFFNQVGRKEEEIEEDRWSQEEKQMKGVSTPISESIHSIVGDFPSTVITKMNRQEVKVAREEKSTSELQLIFDQMVGCYYHPETNTYYEVMQ